MQILKAPEYENDDYLFRIDLKGLAIGKDVHGVLDNIDPRLKQYYEKKRQVFRSQDTNPNVFSEFVDDKPSLRYLSDLNVLDSTVYTVACEKENHTQYLDILGNVKTHLETKPGTRRCIVRFVNSFGKCFSSEVNEPADITCLSFIHYLQSGPKMVFRASDIKNELLVDILTIKEFFLDPIYGTSVQRPQLTVYSSTAQGVSSWSNFLDSLRMVCNSTERAR